MKSVRGFGFVVFALIFILASCQANPSEEIKVENVWGRPGTAGGNSALYFMINNSSGQDDVLLKAESSAAKNVELHMSSMDASGKMSMSPQEKVEVSAGEKVEFKPGGLHVMLINLQSDLTVGQKINVSLTFEKAGKIELEAVIQEQ
jgi:copper(I)-binding protein